jgi:hypothetical protein
MSCHVMTSETSAAERIDRLRAAWRPRPCNALMLRDGPSWEPVGAVGHGLHRRLMALVQ